MAIQSLRLTQNPEDPNSRVLHVTRTYDPSKGAVGYPEQFELTPEQFGQFQAAGLRSEPTKDPLLYRKGSFDPARFSEFAQGTEDPNITRIAASYGQVAPGGTDLAFNQQARQDILSRSFGGRAGLEASPEVQKNLQVAQSTGSVQAQAFQAPQQHAFRPRGEGEDLTSYLREKQAAGGQVDFGKQAVNQPVSIPWKIGGTEKQFMSIKNLVDTKPVDQWTETDKKNWNYWTNNQPLPTGGASSVSAAPPQGVPGGAPSSPQPKYTGQPLGDFTSEIDRNIQARQGGVPQETTAGSQVKAPSVQTSDQLRAQDARSRMEGISAQRAEIQEGLQTPQAFVSADERARLRKEQGIIDDEGEIASLNQETRLLQQELRKYSSTAGQGVTEAGRLGAISEAERNVRFRLEDLAIRQRSVIDRLNSKNAYINQAVQDKQTDYNSALNAYNSEYSKNVKAVDLYNERLDDRQKDALTALTTINNLVKDQGVSYDQMNPNLKAQINTYETQLGIQGAFETAYKEIPKDEKILAPVTVENASGGKDVYFYTQSPDGTPNLKKVLNLPGGKAQGNIAGISGGKGTVARPGIQPVISGKVSQLASKVYQTPALLNNFTPTERGKILKELSNAGLDMAKFAVTNVTAAQRDDINRFDTIIRSAQDALSILAKGIDVGPVASAVKGVQAFFGSAPEYTAYAANLSRANSILVNQLSGAAVTPQEFERLKPFMVQPTDDEKTAKVKMDNFLKEISTTRANFIKRSTQTTTQIIESASDKKSGDLRGKYSY